MKSIDRLIEFFNDEMIKDLERHRDSGDLFFSQPIDGEAVEYAKAAINFKRDGNKITAVKIPYQIKKYLSETNEKMKRYHFCHCPLVRNSILQAEGVVSKSFCRCSLGYMKKGFDAALGRELTGRTVKTVLEDGVTECVFEFEIPEDVN